MIYYLILINGITFLLYGIDKYLAIHHKQRIRESTLLLFPLFGGCFGAVIGMVFFHHKTSKIKFQCIIPILTILWSLIILTERGIL